MRIVTLERATPVKGGTQVTATHWLDAGSVYLDGEWQAGAGEDVLETVNPATEERICRIPVASAAQTDAAIAAARRAFDRGPWPRLTPADRSRALTRLVDAVGKHVDELVEAVVDTVGSPVTLARGLQVGGPLECLTWFAEVARAGPDGGWERALPPHPTPPSTSLLVREPVGVVAAITAYNYPLNLLAWKLGGALATGCTVVAMPAPQGTLATIAFFRVLQEADLPPGVANLVVGGPAVGERLTSSPDVDLASFTGSVSVGGRIMAQAAPQITRVVLELGGKAPNILLPGADLSPEAVLPSLLRFTRNAGQGCGAFTRILVQRDEHDAFLEAAAPLLEGLAVGDPWDPETVVGPVISAGHRARAEGYLERAAADGGRIAAGGGRPPLARGWYLNPAIVAGLPNDAELCQEELFAPVAAVVPYDDVDHAVALANATRFGLNANVSGRVSEALAVARRLRAGTVTINGGGGLRPDAPWGGFGASGVGRELGMEGVAEFLETKHIQWPLEGPARPPGMG